VGNTVELTADKSLLVNSGGASMTQARLSPFGANRLAFLFADDSGCGGAQMLLNRGR
jgi:hypothetical protein